MIYANMFPSGAYPTVALPARAVAVPAASHAGDTARGRPPSPYIGASTIVAMQWVVFGACIARWALA